MHNILAVLQGTSTTLSADALDRVFQFINNVGAPYAVLFGILFIAYKLIKPVSDAFVENNRVVRAGLKTSTDTLVKVAEIMEKRETRVEAEARTDGAVKEINDHTDEIFNDAKEQLTKAAADLESAATKIKNVVTQQHLADQLKPILSELQTISVVLLRTGAIEAAGTDNKNTETGTALGDTPVVTDPAPSAKTGVAERVEGSS